MELSICPSCIPLTNQDPNGFGLDVMMRIVAPNSPYRVLLDTPGNILKEYKNISSCDPNAFSRLWLNSLAANLKFKKSDIIICPSDNQNINVLANIYSNSHGRKLITASESLYREHWETLEAFDISLIDDSTARRLLSSSDTLEDKPLLEVLIHQLSIMIERKTSIKLEDFHNDEIATRLETESYIANDQTRAGITGSDGNPGSLDILVKSKGQRHISIIEALRERSCGENNSNIAKHLDKLLNDYDYLGFKTNYLITYCEASDFGSFWDNYVSYMKKINSNNHFRNNIPQVHFFDTEESISSYTNIRIGRGIYLRDGRQVEVIHIVANLHVRT
ncbi:TPA: hypothetical protein RQK21_002220 [Vibrio vulnificus]|uniref:hypothetical protein n=1 Tax=Vibrio vulnificus TaxID=672 RepID=UPI001EEAADC5|nr:hypothetical protein [Vibrio vulnificus]MCG6299520.1 hypothetical protein [Vibrio vulnificus]HDY7532013.1 hypothetical protein [Vibrio vulnificus]HDY7743160.1 hypothetical protein [Vibrio vulnificus]HDY7779926.1 hypothetical protein [Vibrio vulnificus]